MRFTLFAISLLMTAVTTRSQDAIALAEDFFTKVKYNDRDAGRIAGTLASLSVASLKEQLDTEDKAKAFWLNIYNTYIQYLLKADAKLFEDRDSFFKDKRVTIAGMSLSLDDIEHGIIRRSKNKYSFGYLNKLFVPEFEEQFRLDVPDYRIHFALNCGAKSCPSILLYKPNTVNAQLEQATSLYLRRFARYDARKNIVYAPALCSWYQGDFDGEDGVIRIMEKHGIVPAGKAPDVKYTDYNWTLSLSNYIEP
jgi:hypothetical protein